MSPLEKFVSATAAKVVPQENSGGLGVDWITLITLITSVIQSIMQNCPAKSNEAIASIRKPSFLQRVRLFREVKDNCDCCGNRYRVRANEITRALEEIASNTSDEELEQILDEASA